MQKLASTVREIVQRNGRLALAIDRLDDDDDLYDAGMTSHASISVMLDLEDTFEIEFPESLLTRDTFRSVQAMSAAVSQLTDRGR
jgi:acyl carrier protein